MATDLLSVSAEIASILQLAVAAKPQRETENAPGRDKREQVYLGFQRTTQDMALWATHLQAIATAQALTPQRLALVPGLLAEVVPNRLFGEGFRGFLNSISDIARLRFTSELAGDLMREWIAYREVASARTAASGFVDALAQIRLYGAAEPRSEAEKVTSSLTDLFASIDTSWSLRMPGRGHQSAKRRDNSMADLGESLQRFILTVAEDLDRRWWKPWKRPRRYLWQVWRRRATSDITPGAPPT